MLAHRKKYDFSRKGKFCELNYESQGIVRKVSIRSVRAKFNFAMIGVMHMCFRTNR